MIFTSVHSDDLDPVLRKGEPVFPYEAVPLCTINEKREAARNRALLLESIEGSKNVED